MTFSDAIAEPIPAIPPRLAPLWGLFYVLLLAGRLAPLWGLFYVLLLAGCASLTLPNSPEQVVYAAHGARISVVNTTADLLEQDVINVEQAQAIQEQASKVRADIDQAKQLVDLKLPVGDDLLTRVQQAQALLIALQHRLQEHTL